MTFQHVEVYSCILYLLRSIIIWIEIKVVPTFLHFYISILSWSIVHVLSNVYYILYISMF
jgi:hypothetical protein